MRLVGWSNGRLTLGFVWHVPWPEQPLGQYAMAVVARVTKIILESMIDECDNDLYDWLNFLTHQKLLNLARHTRRGRHK